MARLTAYDWPGNVRELENVIEHAVVLAPGAVLELDQDLGPAAPGSRAARPDPGEGADPAPPAGVGPDGHMPTLSELERSHILATLEKMGGVIDGPRGAARLLGLHPNTLRSRMQRLGLRRPRHEMS